MKLIALALWTLAGFIGGSLVGGLASFSYSSNPLSTPSSIDFAIIAGLGAGSTAFAQTAFLWVALKEKNRAKRWALGGLVLAVGSAIGRTIFGFEGYLVYLILAPTYALAGWLFVRVFDDWAKNPKVWRKVAIGATVAPLVALIIAPVALGPLVSLLAPIVLGWHLFDGVTESRFSEVFITRVKDVKASISS